MSLETRLVDFIERIGLRTQQVNRRQWGSYELAMSFDSRTWFHDPSDVFGRAWTTHQAVMMIFAKHITNGLPSNDFRIFMGSHLPELIQIFTYREPPAPNLLPDDTTGECPPI